MKVGLNTPIQMPYTNPVPNRTAKTTSFIDTMKSVQNGQGKDSTQNGNTVDFTNMTRKELSDWMEDKIQKGEMTYEESRPFRLMLMKIRVSDNYVYTLEEDDTRYNFIERAQGGIGFAKGSSDTEMLAMLDSAISIMKKNQDKSIAIEASYSNKQVN